MTLLPRRGSPNTRTYACRSKVSLWVLRGKGKAANYVSRRHRSSLASTVCVMKLPFSSSRAMSELRVQSVGSTHIGQYEKVIKINRPLCARTRCSKRPERRCSGLKSVFRGVQMLHGHAEEDSIRQQPVYIVCIRHLSVHISRLGLIVTRILPAVCRMSSGLRF